jgi:hypothetical protein
MIFFIRHGDQEHTVRVETRNGQLVVRYGDEPEEQADLNFFGNDCTFVREGQVFFANVVGDKTDYTVWRPAGNIQFGVESEYERHREYAARPKSRERKQRLRQDAR